MQRVLLEQFPICFRKQLILEIFANRIFSPGIGVIDARKASVVLLSWLATFTYLLIS